tara:strand:+ start:23188 stop:28020 length:4833 start_codon:yes stop_codon:yes gene_type:complete
MKKNAQNNSSSQKAIEVLSNKNIETLQDRLIVYEKEKHILLELSNDITKVREKNDLIKVFSSRLKSFFYFTHAVVSLIDKRNKTYYPFLIDTEVLPIKHRDELPVLLQTEYLITDPFIQKIVDSEKPVSFLLKEIIEKPGIPAFLRVNYECGIKRAMIARLKSKMETIGYVFIYSDREEEFSDNFIDVLHGIAPHLSNAVSNVIINEKIEYNEKVNKILLSLSHDMVMVRDRTNLLNLIKFGLKKLIYFTHNVITVFNETSQTYEAFLIDPDSRAKKFSEYAEMIKRPCPFNDGIIDVATKSAVPVVFDMTRFDMNKAPLWLKLNYQSGAREMIIKALPDEVTPKHTLILFSDRTNNFDQKAIDIIERVSSQLSTAISNISANEEIVNKEKDKSFLLEFSQHIASARTKDELSAAIHQSLKKLAQVKAYFIRTINADGKTMSPLMYDKDVFYLESKAFHELLTARIPIDTGITGKVMKENGPVFIDMVEEVSQGNTDHYVKFWKTLGAKKNAFQKLIGIPLRLGTDKLGILWVITHEINTVILEGISAQISVAISNINSNEDIINREAEKSILLSITNEIANLTKTDDLLQVVNKQLKALFKIENFGFQQINSDGTYSSFMLDLNESFKSINDYDKITSTRYPIGDPVFTSIMNSDDPIIFVVNELIGKSGMPAYVNFWKKLGQRHVIGTSLRVGGKNIGFAFFHVDAAQTTTIKLNLLKSVCAQISVAISNIQSKEEILNREKEKSILLSISQEIAELRKTDDLLRLVNKQLKTLFKIEDFGFLQINSDGTYSPFMIEMSAPKRNHPDFETITTSRFPIGDPIFERIMNSVEPALMEVDVLASNEDMPPYVSYWKKIGQRHIIGLALRVGGKHIGLAFFHVDIVQADRIKMTLLKSVCAQISVAISNIRSNEEIINREEEKSILLSISDEITALRKADDLLLVVNKKMKTLFSIEEFGFLQMFDDGTYGSFMFELSEYTLDQAKTFEFSNDSYRVDDPVFKRVMNSEEPIIFDVNKLLDQPRIPDYIGFWKKLGYKKVLGIAMRVGGKNIGCAFFYIDTVKTGKLKINLLKAVCNQIAVAISNIKSNDEIVLREEEKSKLLSLSMEIAALRSRSDLLKVVNSKLKMLFSIQEFGLAKIDEDGATYSAFVIDVGETIESDKNFKNVTTANYSVTDFVFSRIITSEEPVLFDVNSLARKEGVPAYVGFWNKTGVPRVLGMALRAGGKNIGCAFLHVGASESGRIKSNLLKGICAQLSVAVSNILANEQILSYKRRLEVENDQLKEQIKTIYNFSDIIGGGPEMQKVYKMMSLVADTNSTVLILGETGTGKELIARAIHNSSPRKDKLMIKVNCAALPTNLIESELFGHERGSFTGAAERRIGKFELANKGTLFLDEIGEMPLETQVKLLRVLQERELERVGGNVTITVDVRIIAATNRNLEEEVKEGRFRSDLYYRLNVFPISLPALRERLEDMEDLVDFFLSRYSKNTGRKVTGVSPKAMQELKSYLWPGNVRELEHLIERSVLFTEGNVLKEIQLPNNKKNEDSEKLNLSNKTLHELERAYIIEILKRCSGKIAGAGGASELLDLPPTTLHSKIKKLDISKEDYFSKIG